MRNASWDTMEKQPLVNQMIVKSAHAQAVYEHETNLLQSAHWIPTINLLVVIVRTDIRGGNVKFVATVTTVTQWYVDFKSCFEYLIGIKA